MVAGWRPDFAAFFSPSSSPNNPSSTPVWVAIGDQVTAMSGCKRGRQYELDQFMANAPTATVFDPDETLNPGNVNGAYYGRLLPYREVLVMATTAGQPGVTGVNILNATNRCPATDAWYDPGFEASTPAACPEWIIPVGGVTPIVAYTPSWEGTRRLGWNVATSSAIQGVSWTMPTVPGRAYTASADVGPTSASTQRLAVDGAATTTTTAVDTWVRLTRTWVASQPTSVAQLATTTGTAVAGTVFLDGLQLEEAATATTWTDAGPVLQAVFRGFTEQFPRSWTHAGRAGWCQMRAVDGFGPISRFRLKTEVRNAIAALKPLYWWPLGEPYGAAAWGEQSGSSALALTAALSDFGYDAGTSTLDAGVGTGIAGDPDGVGVEFVGSTTGSPSNVYGAMLRSRSVSVPATVPFDLSVSVWWIPGPPLAGTLGNLCQIYSPAIGDRPLMIGVDRDGGTLSALIGTVGTSGAEDVTVAFDFTDDIPRLLTATLSVTASATSLRFYIDGSLVGAAGGTTLSYTSTTATDVSIIGGTGKTHFVAGVCAHFAIWDRALSAAEVAGLWAAGTGGVRETSGARIGRYLSYGFNGPTALDVGDQVMGVNSLNKETNLLPAIQDVALTENGAFFCDRWGNARFHARSRRYVDLGSPRVTFGEDVAAGEYPYLDGAVYNIDQLQIVNDVSVTNNRGATFRRTDDDSIAEFFPNAASLTISVADDQDAARRAQWTVNTHKDPQQRVQQLVLDPVGHPRLWPVVLTLEIGDLVWVNTRPKAANSGAGLLMSDVYFVESISHDSIDMAACTWRTTLQLSPAVAVQIVESPEQGRLDTSGSALAVAINSTSTGSMSVTTTSGPIWTTSAADFPMDINVGGERVRISSIIGGGATQTFTIAARSLNGMVSAHSVGAAVSLWDTGRVAL